MHNSGSRRLRPRGRSAEYSARAEPVRIDPAQLQLFRAELLAQLRPEVMPSKPLLELWGWWKSRFLDRLESKGSVVSRMEKHVLPRLGHHTSATLTADHVEELLVELDLQADLAPRTLNHCRIHLHKLIEDARDKDLWPGSNPVDKVQRRDVAQTKREILEVDEVLRLFAAAGRWLPMFALAIGMGLRKGELLGLQKVDLHIERKLLDVCRSHGKCTTKNRRVRQGLPIPEWLVPMLEHQVASAPGDYVFPRADGRRHRKDVRLEERLRRAFGRADLVVGYEYVCRWCRVRELRQTREPDRCAKCDRRLWITPLPRAITFHGLRHICATLHRRAGCDPLVIQLLLGHAPRSVTDAIYTHLDEGYVREQVNKLRLEPISPPNGGGSGSSSPLCSSNPKAAGSIPAGRAFGFG